MTSIDVKDYSDTFGVPEETVRDTVRKLRISAESAPEFSQVFASVFNLGEQSDRADFLEALFDYITTPTLKAEIMEKLGPAVKARKDKDFEDQFGFAKEIELQFGEAYAAYNRDRRAAETLKSQFQTVITELESMSAQIDKHLQSKWSFFYDYVKEKKVLEDQAICAARTKWRRMSKSDRLQLNNDVHVVITEEIAKARLNFEKNKKNDASFKEELKRLMRTIRDKESPETVRRLDDIFLEIEDIEKLKEKADCISDRIKCIFR